MTSAVIGSPSKPLILTGGDYYVQSIDLRKGWNWVSLNVLADVVQVYNSLLLHLPMHEGDIVADVDGGVNVYTNGQWMTSAGNTNENISHKKDYYIPHSAIILGLLIRQKNKAITFTGGRSISSIGISLFKVKRLFSG
jgi:hypothetical protein